MGRVHSICAVATKEQYIGESDWTTRYKLSTSKDGRNWTTYEEGGSEKVSQVAYMKKGQSNLRLRTSPVSGHNLKWTSTCGPSDFSSA